jgi:DNA ligase-1
VREQLESNDLEGFDGELCLTDLTAKFNEVSSALSRYEGTPEFSYVIFDYHAEPELSYQERFLNKLDREFPDFVVVVPMKVVNSIEELMRQHHEWILQGFEGTMVRRFDGEDFYKMGRATLSQGFLGKVKDFSDDEAVVIGFTERMSNQNEATKDHLGHTARSSHLANMVGLGDLGAILVKSDKFDEPFSVGSGFDDKQRTAIFNNQEEYLGKLAKFRHQPSGAKDGGSPRFPTFVGWRDLEDM